METKTIKVYPIILDSFLFLIKSIKVRKVITEKNQLKFTMYFIINSIRFSLIFLRY